MKITINTIDHNQQRYNTCGDYMEMKDGSTIFLISKMKDKRYEQLVLVHELVEYFLVKYKKIPLKSIDEFDIAFEKKRKQGDTSEPGDDPKAPYYRQHQAATVIEHFLALYLGVDWNDYEKAVLSLPYDR